MLKDKGDKFFRMKAFDAAVNSYTASIKIDAEFAACFAARAECQLVHATASVNGKYRSRLRACVDDTFAALSLLSAKRNGARSPPSDTEEERSRQHLKVSVLFHRSDAYLRLGDFRKALGDLQAIAPLQQKHVTSFQLHARSSAENEGKHEQEKAVLLLEKIEARAQHAQQLLEQLEAGVDKDQSTIAAEILQSGAESDFSSALSALDRSIEINPGHARRVAQRALVHFALKDWDAVLLDCEYALSVVQKAGDYADDILTARLLAVQATAHCHMCTFQQATRLFQQAIQVLTATEQEDSEQFLAQVQQAQQRVSKFTKSNKLRQRGDDAANDEKFRLAIQYFSQSLCQSPWDGVSLSNAAACHLRLEEYPQCVETCTQALDWFDRFPRSEEGKSDASTTSDKKSSSVEIFLDLDRVQALNLLPYKLILFKRNTLVRRGSALCFMGKPLEAKADYEQASALVTNLLCLDDHNQSDSERQANEARRKKLAMPRDVELQVIEQQLELEEDLVRIEQLLAEQEQE